MRNSRGNTLLVELTVVLLFFALSQAIVLQVFAKAQQLNRETEAQHQALTQARDVAETLAVSDQAEATLAAMGFAPQEGGTLAYAGEGYRLSAAINRLTQTTGVITTVTLTAWRGDTQLFELPATRYQGGATP